MNWDRVEVSASVHPQVEAAVGKRTEPTSPYQWQPRELEGRSRLATPFQGQVKNDVETVSAASINRRRKVAKMPGAHHGAAPLL